MSERKINLEDILIKMFENGQPFYNQKDIKNAMLQFGKQLLELAVDNVLKVKYIETGNMDESVCDSILDTIKQVE